HKEWNERERVARGPRIKRPPPTGLLARELAAQVGVTIRTIRYYVAQKLLPRPQLRGTQTRYSREHLLRLLAIQAMQRDGLRLPAIRAKLNACDAAALEQYAPKPTVAERSAAGTDAAVTLFAPAARTYASETWERIALLPGLELFVRADASPLVRQ